MSAGGGIAFVLVGALAGVSKGGGRARIPLAGTCGSLGVVMVATNLLAPEPLALVPITMVVSVLAAAFAGALAWTLAQQAPRRERIAIGAGGAVAVALLAAGTFADPAAIGAAFGAPPELASLAGYTLGLFTLMVLAIIAAGAAAGAAYGSNADPVQRRALAALGFGLLAFPAYVGSRGIAYPLPVGYNLSVALGIVGALIAWRPRDLGDGASRRSVFLALLGLALASLAYAVVGRPMGITMPLDQGAGGSVRTLAAFVLARAILRGGLLDLEPPQLARRRGAAPLGALAAFFIVAQVAQNFLSAQYGLLMGGIVAGAFAFAAQPLQRLMEPASLAPSRAAPSARASGEHDEAYRAAVRVALRDRRLTRDEEVALADVAERLGIGARRAAEIRHDVEREKGLS